MVVGRSLAQLLSICSERGDLAEGPNFQLQRLDGRSARSRVLYDNPGDTLLRRRYIYRPWSTLQVPGYAAVLCYAGRPWSILQVPGFVPISGLLGTGLEYPAGIRFAAKTRRDSFTPSVPALEYPAEVPGVVLNSGGTPVPASSTLQVPGYVRNPGGTLLRRRYRPRVPCRYISGLLLKPGGTPLRRRYRPWSTLQVPGFVRKPGGALLALEYPAGIRFTAKTRRDSFTAAVPASSTLQVPGYVRNPGGTLLRRRYRPRVPCRYISGLLLKPGGTPLRRRYRPWSTLQVPGFVRKPGCALLA